MKVNERRNFELPTGYSETSPEGKFVTVSVLLKEIKEIYLPSVEEIIKSYNECKTVEDFKNYIFKELLSMKEAQKENLMKEKLLNKLIEDYDFEIPSIMYSLQLNFEYRKELNKLKEKWINVPLFFIDFSAKKDKLSQQATNIVRRSLILQEIAKNENIFLTEEEEKKRLEELAKEMGLNPLALKAKLEKDEEYDNLLVNWLNDKVIDFLYQHAIIIK